MKSKVKTLALAWWPASVSENRILRYLKVVPRRRLSSFHCAGVLICLTILHPAVKCIIGNHGLNRIGVPIMSKIDIFDSTQPKLSIKQVADLLNRSPRTVRSWITTKGLEAAKIGGEWFTTRDAVMEFVDKSTNGSEV